MHEVVVTGRKAGYEAQDWGKLAHDEAMLRQVLAVVRGQAEIKPFEHVINCDAAPFIPDGFTVEEHKKGGQWKFDPKAVAFYLSKQQKGDKYIEGNKFRKELEGKPVLNANVLDYLLKYPHLLPEEWKKDERYNTRYIFFWGTLYRNRVGSLCVRYLYWDGGRWYSLYYWLVSNWLAYYPAACAQAST